MLQSFSAALRDLLQVCETVCYGTHIAQSTELLAARQTAFCYGKALCNGTDPSLHHPSQHIFSAIARPVLQLGHFFFERSKKAFHTRIVIRASGRAHGSLNSVFSQHTLVCSATVLTSSVAVENKSLVSPSKSQGIGQRSFAQFAVDIFAHFIADPPLCFSNPGRQQDNPTTCWWEYRQYLLPRVH